MLGQTLNTNWIFKRFRCFIIFSIYLIGSVTTANSVELKLATESIRSLNRLGMPYIECAFTNSGDSFEIITLPWARAQLGTRKGIYDGFFMASRNDRRDEYAVLSEPFFNIKWLYVVTKESGLSPDNPDFFQNSFAANNATSRHTWLDDKYEKGKITNPIVTTPDAFGSLEMLAMGRVDVLLENDANLEAAYKQTDYTPSEFNTFVAKEIPVGLYFGKSFVAENPDFLNSFNARIKGCKPGGQ